jgi:excisionase family DNA binding protein
MEILSMHEPLALRPNDAARLLGISRRTLYELTAPRGPIPCIRTRRAVLYPLTALQRWLESAATDSNNENG